MDCSTSKASENIFLLLFFYRCFPLQYVFTYSAAFLECSKEIIISLHASRNQTSNKRCLKYLFKRRSKGHQNNILQAHLILADEKYFPKIISQQGFSCTKLPRTIVFRDVSPSSFKLKGGTLPPLT